MRVECHPLSETCAVPCTYDEQARLGNSERVPPVCRYYLYALLSEGWSRIRSSRCYSATPEAVSSRRRPPDDYRASGASARNPVWTQSSSSAVEHLGLGGARRGWAGRMRSYHILRHRRCRRVAALLHQYAKPEMPRPGVRPGAAATNPGLKLKLKFLQLSRLEVAGRAGPQLRPSRVPVPAPPGPQPDLNSGFFQPEAPPGRRLCQWRTLPR